MAADYKFEATPTLNNGIVQWKLCYLNPPSWSEPLCGTTKETYPDVYVQVGKKNPQFEFTIVGDQTGRNIKFADNPIWIGQNGPPTGPVLHSQINDLKKDARTLTFKDKNDTWGDLRPDVSTEFHRRPEQAGDCDRSGHHEWR